MKIIAFDLGKNMAWASNVAGKLVAGVDVFEGARAHRLGQILDRLEYNLKKYGKKLDVAIYETPFARGRDATRSLWGIAGLIEACADRYELPVVDASVPTIKKFATGSGRGSKEEMLAAAKKFGYRGSNEHEADAVCLLKYAEANLERVAE